MGRQAKVYPVPRPVAAGQTVGPWFRLQGFLAVEELHGMLPLHEAVPLAAKRLDSIAFARWKRGLTAELARLARELHRRNVFHKDLYFCHFYIPESFTRMPPAAWTNRVVMIDLHRLARAHVDGRVVAGEGPRAAALLVGCDGGDGARPRAVLEAVPRRMAEPRRRRLAAAARAVEVAALSCDTRGAGNRLAPRSE